MRKLAPILRSDLGSIRVRGTSGSEVVVRVIEGVDGLDRRAAQALFDRFDVTFDQSRAGIEIEGTYDRPRSWRSSGQLQVAYEIQVPHAYNVDLHTAGGSVSVEQLRGDAKVRTAGGSIQVYDVEGPVIAHTSGGSITAERLGEQARLHTSGGSITAEAVQGDVVAETSGGSIRLSRIAGAVDAHTSGGSIAAELTGQPARPMTLRTSGGSVRLALEAGVRAEIDAEASGGRVRTDLPVTGRLERGRLRGALNGGGPLLTLRSSGGSVSIERR